MIYNAFPTTTGEGEEASINGTAEVPFKEIGLKGNTSQESTTGKNLFDISKVITNETALVNNGNGTITVTTASNNSQVIAGEPRKLKDYCPNLQVGDSVYLTANSTGTNKYIYLATTAQVWTFGTQRTITQNDLDSTVGWYASGVATTATISDIMISTSGGDYEPYTGGNPAPNPDYPYPVNVVTGDNSITISNNDNAQSQTYPINLGSMELCKIGDYQDSIVKDNGKWYLKKEIGKVVLDGSESWNQWGTDAFFITRLSTIRTGLSNYYKYNSTAAGAGQLSNGEFFIHDSANHNSVIFKNSSYTTVADFKTWLSTHNTMLYYVLATPTITEITDTTLIEQLDNLEKAYSYDTQTNISQTNQDKPFIISYEAILSLRNVLNNLETRIAVLETE